MRLEIGFHPEGLNSELEVAEAKFFTSGPPRALSDF